MNVLFLNALPLLKKIEDAGFEVFFVGGAVRDCLLDRPISDVDIASSATPEEIKRIFPNTVDVGIEHGTVVVLYQGQSYEITTFREEAEYRDHRRPDEVFFVRSLIEDLKRRDFTMNAIAMNKEGEIIDPFNGKQAISKKQIVTVGDPKERFTEDALRMMRAVRFVSQLDFTLDPTCFDALKKMGSLLNHIAVERKTAEFEKLLVGKNRVNAIQLLCSCHLDQYLPQLGLFEKTISELTQFKCSELNSEEMWGLLLYSLEVKMDQVDHFLRCWKLPIKRIRQIQAIYHWTQFRLSHEWSSISLYDAGKENMIYAQRLVNSINHQELMDSVNSWIKLYDDLPIKGRAELNISR
ncbi:CCA tRNA nucleotidyltransferase [Bacillus sp. T3]|uniref:CCA tRNA nucleotidyltransferase n=1 Tax=Bacillus sp. T3 TaxID=467262 RepID=UPI002980F070|nr:CCA tRNA nucleotidyltransferase [Bacillus sp. T3]